MATTLPLERPDRQIVHVDPAKLTPRAAALARLWSTNPLHTRCPVVLESIATRREMGADPDEVTIWDGMEAMDQRHRMVWASWSRWKVELCPSAEDYVESQAARLPIGYVPVASSQQLDEVSDDMRVSADLITRDAALKLLSRLGRPLTVGTFANYNKRPPEGWPGVAHRVGRTPLFSATKLAEYARLNQG